jgi:hypothetical protein
MARAAVSAHLQRDAAGAALAISSAVVNTASAANTTVSIFSSDIRH